MLTLCPNPRLIPEGMLRAEQIANTLGVHVDQVNKWCKEGVMLGEHYEGQYWVRVDTVRSFIERSKWILAADPTGVAADRSWYIGLDHVGG